MIAYLQTETEILATKRACIVSLPIKILDGINIEVFVEETMGGYLVHDGGRSMGSIESSGLILTEKRIEFLSQLAKRLGASFEDGVFRSFAKNNAFQDAVFAIAQCCSVATVEMLKHSPSTEEDQIRSRVSIDINKWGHARDISVFSNRKIPGRAKQYTIDFVAEAPAGKIAINVLIPSYNASVSAERYALQMLDIGNAGYKRLAVLAKPHLWKKGPRAMVAKFAATAEFDESAGFFSGHDNVADSLDRLAQAA